MAHCFKPFITPLLSGLVFGHSLGHVLFPDNGSEWYSLGHVPRQWQ